LPLSPLWLLYLPHGSSSVARARILHPQVAVVAVVVVVSSGKASHIAGMAWPPRIQKGRRQPAVKINGFRNHTNYTVQTL
jgi:hypothetical protein